MDCQGLKERGNRIPLLGKEVRKMYVRRCPRALVEENPDSLDYWDEYLTWKCFNALPVLGGTDDQDCKVIEAIKYISNLINQVECDDDYIKWQRKKSKDKLDKEEKDKENKINSFADISKNRKMKNG